MRRYIPRCSKSPRLSIDEIRESLAERDGASRGTNRGSSHYGAKQLHLDHTQTRIIRRGIDLSPSSARASACEALCLARGPSEGPQERDTSSWRSAQQPLDTSRRAASSTSIKVCTVIIYTSALNIGTNIATLRYCNTEATRVKKSYLCRQCQSQIFTSNHVRIRSRPPHP